MLPLMTRLAVLALAVLAAGCPSSDIDDYPIGGGGGGGGGPSGPGRDASTGDASGDGQALISGRVCVVNDLRRLLNALPTDCRTTGANGLSVVLGDSAPATTAQDGTFAVPAQQGTNVAWAITGATVVRSVVPGSPGAAPLLPAISDLRYMDLLNQNSVLIDQSEGSIVARIIRGGLPVMGATAQVVGGESLQTLYDSNNPEVWGVSATGALGVAWLPDNAVGPRTLRVTSGTLNLSVPVTIFDQSITFVTIALPQL